MTETIISTIDDIPEKYRFPLLIALIVSGFVINYFQFPLFLNIDFIFGSIFALLALQTLGRLKGVLAAILIATFTYIIWNHPYDIITMAAEVAVVGFLIEKRKLGMVLSDAIFWLILGMPLLYLFNHVIMHVPHSNTFIDMAKHTINGIVNALIARLIFTCLVLCRNSRPIPFKEIIYNVLAFFVLCPTLIMMAISSRSDYFETDYRIRSTLIRDAERLSLRLNTWILNRQQAILNLAEIAATKSPKQMQPYLEMAKKSDLNFLRVGLHNKETIVTAHFPLIDELGKPSIGKNFSDRPYIPVLKQTLRPLLTEVFISKIGEPEPIVAIVAPVINRGDYDGYVVGVLRMAQLREDLSKAADENTMLYTLVDKNGNVIMSNFNSQLGMTPFARPEGSFQSLEDNRVKQWVPKLPANTPVWERWRNSFYVTETTIGNMAEWNLILEQPIAPFQKMLYENYTKKLGILFLILIAALLMAEFLSRKIVVALEELSTITKDLPLRLATEDKSLAWPESIIQETHLLIDNFKLMAQSLTQQFSEVKKSNEQLEQRVSNRTRELRESEEAYRTVANFTYDWEYWLTPEGKFRYVSPSCERHTGYRAHEFQQDPDLMLRIIHSDDRAQFGTHITSITNVTINTKAPTEHHADFRILTKNGEERWFEHVCQPVFNEDHIYLGQRATNRDITERQKRVSDIRFLSKASQVLTESLETGDTLRKIATLAISEISDGCIVRVLKDDGSLEDQVIVHTDPKKEQNLRNLLNSFQSKGLMPPDTRESLKKQAVIVRENFQDAIRADFQLDDFENSELANLGKFSTALIPLIGHGRTLGMLRLFSNELSKKKLKESDIPFFESFGNRTALSIENARLYAETKRAVRVREEILAIVSHDLRSPLTNIQMAGQLLPKLTNDLPKIVSFSEKILKSSAQMKRMIEDLMDFAKIQEGALSIEKKMEKPNEVLEMVFDMIKSEADQKGINFSLDANPDLPLIQFDKHRIAQALLNLVGNAVKFTETGGRVQLSAMKSDGGVKFSVTDTGPGISKVDLPKIFDRYWQAKRSKTSSAGLGLAITKGIIEAHESKVWVESELGVGSTFSFMLPIPS